MPLAPVGAIHHQSQALPDPLTLSTSPFAYSIWGARNSARFRVSRIELERYEDSYRLCHVRGPEGIIVEPAEQIS
ncbi:hypothetical protein ACFVKB_20750 [Rhodococcus sp. NPDC127530]|uniref:hypothetical protein n=1 Tax=unclassified Rhodococcus (in: high G+C Gram-positive bacteria) TaxID=192944 RepID=UPI003629EB78